MLFNSGEFFFFFIAVYLLYVALSHRNQNRLLLAASYFFYGYWDWRFLGLILISTIVDYSAGIAIRSAKTTQNNLVAKRWLIFSIMVNLGILGFFKYFNFFTESFSSIANLFGWKLSFTTLKIILPVGISFYTFQTMSYSIDVYRGVIKPTKQFFDFALFVSFFPQLMAGPIERAKKLLPQIQNKRNITYHHLTNGGWLLLWGVFKKVFIADNLAPYSFWSIYSLQSPTSGDLLIGGYAFIIQFYCDFSGYSDMARGLASLMGFKLSLNFDLPYFATNPTIFLRKWHITFGNWLRDYCYVPIAKRINSRHSKIIALLFALGLSGLWHGAAWKFIIWGILWAFAIYTHFLISPYLLKIKNKKINSLIGFGGFIYTIHLWILIGIFFVMPDFNQIFKFYKIFFTDWTISKYTFRDLMTILYFIWPLILVQFSQLWSKDLDIVRKWPFFMRITFYSTILFLLITNGAEGGEEFIYFQF